MTTHYHVKTDSEAWTLCNSIFPTDYEYDSSRSNGAGYPTYGSTSATLPHAYYNYICDLGDRLELNLCGENWESDTVNIWIDDEPEAVSTDDEPGDIAPDAYIATATAASEAVRTCDSLHPLFAPSVQQRITICIDEPTQPAIFAGLRAEVPGLPSDILTRYCDMIGLPWGTCTASARFVEYGNGKGHYIVDGAVSARIGHELEFLQSCTALLFDMAADNRK